MNLEFVKGPPFFRPVFQVPGRMVFRDERVGRAREKVGFPHTGCIDLPPPVPVTVGEILTPAKGIGDAHPGRIITDSYKMCIIITKK